jgi:glycosyltransferase involved in cell wall biosynthesis
MPAARERVPVLYLAPWVDIGGSDKGTIDWFRFLDRNRFAPSLITTQPSLNRRLGEVIPYATEVWDLPDLISGEAAARFILGFVHTREIRLVHMMNSRLAFDLLPTIARLPSPPRIVVQLHLEEPDCSGYVRYVTTRYGNLVDAYSVSSQALCDRLDAYQVPIAKRRLIHTGVDGRGEFAPGRVKPHPGIGTSDRLEILFPARLTAQKDPLLMIDIAARLKADGLRFRVHVVGGGELEGAMRERLSEAQLAREVILHGEYTEIAPWYAACDVVVLTSMFEGLPYVAYEAMAMGKVLVLPHLPGLDELVTPGTGVLVSPRDDPAAYAEAIQIRAGEPQRRALIGQAARSRASEFPVEQMGAEHSALYAELLDPVPEGAVTELPTPPETPAFRSRRSSQNQLVSVIVACFNQGHYLEGCLASVDRQTHAPVETIVVDDGSTQADTLDALARIEERGGTKVLRLPRNSGPSAARNAAIEIANGRFVLPVDADDVLLPGAVAALVSQLRSAGERIGFVYPNLQFFGNLSHYFEPPSYNLDALTRANYCDTCSLIDREVFDRGLRFPEDASAFHEDWDFFLTLAERGIYGEPALAKTVLHRKHGFTRSDSIPAAGLADLIASRHPSLFDQRARAWVKGQWSPALSLIALDPDGDDALQGLVAAAARQTCSDFELVIVTDDEPPPTRLGRRLRRVPAALAQSRAQTLSLGLGIARGKHVLGLYGSPASLLSDVTVIEKCLRALQGANGVGALALADGGQNGLPALRLLDAAAVRQAHLHGLLWHVTGSPVLELPADRPLETVVRWLSLAAPVQWRQLAIRAGRPMQGRRDLPATIRSPRHRRKRDARVRIESDAQLPELPPRLAERLGLQGPWIPAQARLVCRHVDPVSGEYRFSNQASPPQGFTHESILGCVCDLSFAGTEPLVTRERLGCTIGEHVDHDAIELLGFLEQVEFPFMAPLFAGRHGATGQQILASGHADRLLATLEDPVRVGYLDCYPPHSWRPPVTDVAHGLVGLVRTADRTARRHRYGVGTIPPGQLAGELGALLAEPIGDCEPLWIDPGGRARSDRDRADGPSLGAALRWVGAPMNWRGRGPLAPRARAMARRAVDCALLMAPSRPTTRAAHPAGYLLRSPAAWTLPLYCATHPVIDDQLLSTSETEPQALGYVNVELLGHLVARPLLTGTLGIVRAVAPWANNFGQVTTR